MRGSPKLPTRTHTGRTGRPVTTLHSCPDLRLSAADEFLSPPATTVCLRRSVSRARARGAPRPVAGWWAGPSGSEPFSGRPERGRWSARLVFARLSTARWGTLGTQGTQLPGLSLVSFLRSFSDRERGGILRPLRPLNVEVSDAVQLTAGRGASVLRPLCVLHRRCASPLRPPGHCCAPVGRGRFRGACGCRLSGYGFGA